MRFTLTDVMTHSEYLPRLVVAAEAAGYDGFTIPDSIAYPEHSDAVHPYTGDGDRSFLAVATAGRRGPIRHSEPAGSVNAARR
jgi:alkanesulfonate monooxygenase SsuD/methylene tetrahydromethanopterin reductase-like flavin-dependent oxidoreductase (luciferase family)